MFSLLKGYNTYFTAAAGILAAVGAYGAGLIGLPELGAAVWAAWQTVNIRKAIG
jgi:hypothetical protein